MNTWFKTNKVIRPFHFKPMPMQNRKQACDKSMLDWLLKRALYLLSWQFLVSLISFFIADNKKAAIGHSVSLIPSLPPGSVINKVVPGDLVEIREFRLHSIYSHLTNKTLKSSSGIPSERNQDCIKAVFSYSFPLSLCHLIVGSFVLTTSAFKPLPGDTLTVGFSGTTYENHTYKNYFTIDIACSFNRTQNFYESLEHDVPCLNRTYHHATKGFRLGSYQWKSLHSRSRFDSLLLEIDSSKFSSFSNKSIMVAATLYAPLPHGHFDQKPTKRSLAFDLTPRAQSTIVRMPIDEALKPRVKGSPLTLELVTGVKDSRAIKLPYVEGGVKLVVLSRNASCSKNECNGQQLSTEMKSQDAQAKGCYTIGQLYKSCYGECFNFSCSTCVISVSQVAYGSNLSNL